MKIKDWLIKKLEKDVEYTAGHINLEELDEEERSKCFIQFGEGDENLTSFLKTAYKNGVSSLYCCSGHGVQSAYVVLKVTDDNIELLRKMGRILSKDGIVTNFENNHIRGLCASYRSINSASTEWLDHATRIMENPELFKDVSPEIYYHEEIISSYKPFGYDLKKKILHHLRKNRKELPQGEEMENSKTPVNEFKKGLKTEECSQNYEPANDSLENADNRRDSYEK